MTRVKTRWLVLALLLLVMGALAAVACSGPTGPAAPPGSPGQPGPAGATGPQGPQGVQGVSGAQGLAGAAGKAGPSAPAGPAGPAGLSGLPGPAGAQGPMAPGVDRQVNLSLTMSKPANGTNFVAGEQPVLTITLKDQQGNTFDRANDFSQLRLMASGPVETADTTTAVKLLKTSADRTQTVHHYIDLKTNPDVQVSGSVLTYKLGAVSDEKPGTYTASVWAVSKASGLQQAIATADFQVKTATAEKQIVAKENCASCHLGADSGKFYFAHIDPRTVGQSGNFALDQAPVTVCKTCHNNDGYSAYVSPADGKTRVPDPIVNRVHGIHNGEDLKNPLNTDPTNGVFKDYTGVIFPANVKNCTSCHVDERWKTKPSTLACGTCHDNTWFGDAASMPKTAVAHKGGAQANDAACAACHTPDTGGVAPIAVAHKVEFVFKQTVDLALTPPANGKFYVAGDKPKVTITIKDAKTGTPINPSTIVEPKDATKVQPNEWRRANLFVSGPRARTMPVLTTEAANPNPAHFYPENDLRVLKDPTHADPRISRTATSIVYQLDDVAGLKPGTYAAFVEIMPPDGPLGGWGLLNFQVGTDKEEPKVATNCIDCHKDNRQHPEFFAVQYNPDICKSCHDYERQGSGTGWGFGAPGTSTGWNGFGAAPIVKKVHGVHKGRYLQNPEDLVFPVLRGKGEGKFDFSETIFPQDVRNCTKCHSAETTGTWKTEPSRLACMACHDSDAANTHATLMTQNPTPADPWNKDRVETCQVCHGKGKEFSPDKVHNISNPYKPPYPREPNK